MANNRAKNGLLIKTELSFTIKQINELIVFGETSISGLEGHGDETKTLTIFKSENRDRLLRAVGV